MSALPPKKADIRQRIEHVRFPPSTHQAVERPGLPSIAAIFWVGLSIHGRVRATDADGGGLLHGPCAEELLPDG
jgi:hypothetical protein